MTTRVRGCALVGVVIFPPKWGNTIMLHNEKSKGDKKEERRKHWRDRRVSPERRNPERLQRTDFDCRSGVPRRQSDIGGELAEGEIWWEEGVNYT